MLGMVAWLAIASGGAAEAGPADYAEGQVWEYRTRAGDENSRLKIGRIERVDGREDAPIYHISIAGVQLGGPVVEGLIQHAPVSKETLDASVIRLGDANGLEFGDVEEGIAEWRRARGGVFTISVAEIVDAMVQALASAPLPEGGET